MSQVVYAFELRGIQGYLFNTGRLKDMIQASELIDYIFFQPLDEALKLGRVNTNRQSAAILPILQEWKSHLNNLRISKAAFPGNEAMSS